MSCAAESRPRWHDDSTTGLPAGSQAAEGLRGYYSRIDLRSIRSFGYWINVMTYDFVVATSNLTGLGTALEPVTNDPTSATHPGRGVEAAVTQKILAVDNVMLPHHNKGRLVA